MSDHPIEGMMNTTLEKIKQMVDVNSIVGDPITAPDGTIIIPISKISYGFASGGSDFPSKVQSEKEFFGGGTGAGISINRLRFLRSPTAMSSFCRSTRIIARLTGLSAWCRTLWIRSAGL